MVRLERKEGNEGRRCWGLHGRRECGCGSVVRRTRLGGVLELGMGLGGMGTEAGGVGRG